MHDEHMHSLAPSPWTGETLDARDAFTQLIPTWIYAGIMHCLLLHSNTPTQESMQHTCMQYAHLTPD